MILAYLIVIAVHTNTNGALVSVFGRHVSRANVRERKREGSNFSSQKKFFVADN
jgi:hypothetical protein